MTEIVTHVTVWSLAALLGGSIVLIHKARLELVILCGVLLALCVGVEVNWLFNERLTETEYRAVIIWAFGVATIASVIADWFRVVERKRKFPSLRRSLCRRNCHRWR